MNAAEALENWHRLECLTRCSEDEETVQFIERLLQTAKAAELAGDFMQSKGQIQTDRGTEICIAVHGEKILFWTFGPIPALSMGEALLLIGALTNAVNQLRAKP